MSRPSMRQPLVGQADDGIRLFRQQPVYSSKGREYRPTLRRARPAEMGPLPDKTLQKREAKSAALDSCKIGYPLRKKHIRKKDVQRKRSAFCTNPAKPIFVCGGVRKKKDKKAKLGYIKVTGKSFCRARKGAGRGKASSRAKR